MATVEDRKNKAGKIASFRGLWFEKGEKQNPHRTKSLTPAEKGKYLIEQHGTGQSDDAALGPQGLAYGLEDQFRARVRWRS